MEVEIVVPAIIAGSIVVLSLSGMVKDFLQKREEIRANASVKREEILAKNRLDLERLVHGLDATGRTEQGEMTEDPYKSSAARDRLRE